MLLSSFLSPWWDILANEVTQNYTRLIEFQPLNLNVNPIVLVNSPSAQDR